jgi:protein-tyrosine kinase
MTSKSPNLAERAAAQLGTQLGKAGNLDSSVRQLLGQSASPRPASGAPDAPAANSAAVPPPADASLQQLGQPAPSTARSASASEADEQALSTPSIVRAASRSIDMAALERAGMIDWEQARSRISEEFRIVQRQVLRNSISPDVVEQGNANLVMLTSSRPGEGKSFISLNLAAGIARQQDHDVLLVDIDYKQDSICAALGLAGARGLLDLVTDPTLDPDEVIVRTDLKNLSILPIGRNGERSPELFASRQATRTIQSLGRRYSDRLVVLDSPPCLATSEPGVLASIVGQIVLVVEAEKTQREEVGAAMDLIHTCPTITLLLNKAQLSNRYTFGAYSSSYSQPYTS